MKILECSCDIELERDLGQSMFGSKSADEAIDYLANTLTNRLLHAPTQALRQAAELGDTDLAEAVRRLLTEERNRQ